MSTLLRVLLVEDSEADEQLILRHLQKAGYAIEWARVDNAARMQSALDAHGWDIITADYSLPHFNADSALKLLQKTGLDIPFIVISGAISEEQAVTLMKSGAQDYLRKDNLARMPQVLERELEQAQKRREHRAAEAALRFSEERYRTLVEQASDGIILTDGEGNFLEINPSGCAMLGYTREEMLKLNIRDMLLDVDVKREPLRFNEIRGGRVVVAQRRVIRKDGTSLMAEISAKALPDGRLQGIVRDITERKQAEDELRYLNRVYALTSQVNQMVVRTRDPQEIFAKICRIAVEHGKFRMAWIGLVDEASATVKPVAHYGDEAGYLSKIRQISISDQPEGRGPTGTAIRAGEPFFCNDIANDPRMLPWREEALACGYRSSIALPVIIQGRVAGAFNLYAGEAFFFNPAEVRLLQDLTGDFAYALEMVENEKRRKQVEATLRLQSAALENAANAIHISDRDGTIQWINPAWTALTGYSAEEVIGKTPRILKSNQQGPDYYKKMWETITRGKVWHNELVNRRKDGSLYMEDEIITPVRAEDGQITHFVAIKQDITERKRAEAELLQAHADLEQRVVDRTRELREANLELEKGAHLKDEFLASMSHELRTPLTGILGLAEALQMVSYGDLNEKQRQALKNIESSGRHLLALINDILDLSKIEAGRFEMQMEPCSLREICLASLQLTRGLANQKHQRVSFNMQPEAIILKADARRLKQMLVNLLGNAIKFTPEGGNLGIEVKGEQTEREVSISVWDEGIGIHEQDLPRLFQPFVQLDSSLSRQYAGTGLGLSLVQRLTEMHGGRVEVESMPERGSRFTVVLPWPEEFTQAGLQDRHTRPAGAPRWKAKSGPLVLLADDNETALELVRDFLVSRHCRVVSMHSGEELLQKLDEAPADLILIDIQMPGMDGLEVLRRIRRHPDARIAALPVVTVTALAMPGDRERCLEAGASAYMSKPVRLKELGQLVESLIK